MSTLTKEDIVEAVGSMSLLEVADLVSMFEEKFGVSAAAPVAAAAAGGGAAGAVEEKTDFDVVLTDAGASKIKVLKVVRELTGLGLKEAKAMVDSLPATVKEGVDQAEADDTKAKLEAEGGKVEIK